MFYGAIKDNDIANGEGVRVVLFVSGCRHHCKGCFQPETWNFDYGEPYTDEITEKILGMLDSEYKQGLTILGGEPFEPENQEEVYKLVEAVKAKYPKKDVWCYTGYIFEKDLIPGSKIYTEYTDKLKAILDVIVDGEFVEEEKDISLKFRGSRNQRILRLKDGKIVGIE